MQDSGHECSNNIEPEMSNIKIASRLKQRQMHATTVKVINTATSRAHMKQWYEQVNPN